MMRKVALMSAFGLSFFVHVLVLEAQNAEPGARETPAENPKMMTAADKPAPKLGRDLEVITHLDLDAWRFQSAHQEGKEQTLRELMGAKGLLLDFWASWCGPCMRAMPELFKSAQELPGQGIQVVAINVESLPDAKKGLTKLADKGLQGSFPWLVDGEGKRSLARRLGVEFIPYQVFILPGGEVVASGSIDDVEKRVKGFLREANGQAKKSERTLDLDAWRFQSARQEGKEQTLRKLMGAKGLLLDFWASWCGPCMSSMPELFKSAQELPSQGIQVVAINVESLPDAKKGLTELVHKGLKGSFPWLVDGEGKRSLARHLGVEFIPYQAFILPDGEIIANGSIDKVEKRVKGFLREANSQ